MLYVMKKMTVVIVVLMVTSLCAFAGNRKPTPRPLKPVKIEQKRPNDKPIAKPAQGKKIAKMRPVKK